MWPPSPNSAERKKLGKRLEEDWSIKKLAFLKGGLHRKIKRQSMELSYWMKAFVSMVRKPVFLFSYSTEDRSIHAQSLQSYPALCNLMDCSPPDSSVHGTLQARMLEWVAISFSKMRVYSIIKWIFQLDIGKNLNVELWPWDNLQRSVLIEFPFGEI